MNHEIFLDSYKLNILGFEKPSLVEELILAGRRRRLFSWMNENEDWLETLRSFLENEANPLEARFSLARNLYRDLESVTILDALQFGRTVVQYREQLKPLLIAHSNS